MQLCTSTSLVAVTAHIARVAATANKERPRGTTPRPRSGAEAGRTPCPRGGSQKELPHVRGKGQRTRMPGWDSAGAAERSYPTSEVRVSSRECQATTAQEQLRGATPHPRSGSAAGRSYPLPEARGGGREEQPHFQGTVVAWVQEGLEELLQVQGQGDGGEEIPLVQGKEQWLRFAGAAMKRYPMSKLGETQVRLWVLQEGIRGQTH